MPFSVATSTQTRKVSMTRVVGFVVDSDSKTAQRVRTTATVKWGSVVNKNSLQEQIDDLGAQLPVKDVAVIGTQNFLAAYLLERGA